MAHTITDSDMALGLGKTEEVAKTITQTLRGYGIDVVSGLDIRDCVGRNPLSYFFIHRNDYGDSRKEAVVIASRRDDSIDYLTRATKDRYPGKYFLLCDGGAAQNNYNPRGDKVRQVFCHDRGEGTTYAQLDTYYMDPDDWNAVKHAGVISYDPITGILDFDKEPDCPEGFYPTVEDPCEADDKCVAFHTHDSDNWRDNAQTRDSGIPGSGKTENINEMVRKGVNFDYNTTGARLRWRYRSFDLFVPALPNSSFLQPLSQRLTLDMDAFGERDYYIPEIGETVEEFTMLTQEELTEAKGVLSDLLDKDEPSSRRRYYNDDLKYKSILYVTPAPKGARRPYGHIVVGITDGKSREYGELAICRIDSSFNIGDIYVNVKDESHGMSGFRRLMKRTSTGFKELIDDINIVKGTLGHANNMRNRYAVNAAIDSEVEEGASVIPAALLTKIAKVRFGSEFVEWSYRLGYSRLANDVCDASARSTRAWSQTTSMSDVIPGYVEGSKSIYTCFGMPKAWGKEAFELAVEIQEIQYRVKEDLNIHNLRDAIGAVKLAWNLENHLANGNPSMASVPQRAIDYARILCTWRSDFKGLFRNEGPLVEAYGDDVAAIAETVRSFNRMLVKMQGLGINDWASRTYICETMEAYCSLKSISVDPEEHGVLFEYGLPENDIVAAQEMIRRRCAAAQEVVTNFKALIDAKKRKENEDLFADNSKTDRWLECSDAEVCKDYVFKLPTCLYGDSEPLSVEWEGKHQANCVFNSYTNKLAKGEYTVVLMRRRDDPSSSYVTIGINKNGVIDQTYGYRDSSIDRCAAKAILAWKDKVNSRGKGSLSFKGNPGGWNASVGLVAA